MRRIIMIVFLTVVFAGIAGAATAAEPQKPVSKPDGYVITPNGLHHKSCVRQIAPGERIDAGGAVIHVNGQREQLPPCKYPRLSLHTGKELDSVSPTVNGWVEYASWVSPSPLGSLFSQFVVPTPPTNNGGTIFFFPGSEPSDGSTILQPVLQYGPSAGGGGNYWAAASWFCCPAGWQHYSPLINVNTGDTIIGTMGSSCSGSSCNWSVTTIDMNTSKSTTLSSSNVTTPFTWNVGGVLEAYNVNTCNQFPASGTIGFITVLSNQSGGGFVANYSNSGTICNGVPTSTPLTVTLNY